MSEEADALFLAMPGGDGDSYQPLLAFETRGLMTMVVPGTTETIDPRIATFLEGGFELLSGAEWRFPVLEDWHVAIDEGADEFSVVDSHALAAYSVALSEVTPEWLEALTRLGRCVVITGTGLGLDGETFVFDVVSHAAREGTVVGAVVPVKVIGHGRPGWLGRWRKRRGR